MLVYLLNEVPIVVHVTVLNRSMKTVYAADDWFWSNFWEQWIFSETQRHSQEFVLGVHFWGPKGRNSRPRPRAERDILGRGLAAPPHQLQGLGERPRRGSKCISDALRAQKTRLVAANVVLVWKIDVCWTTCAIIKLLKNVATHLGGATAPGAPSAYATAETAITGVFFSWTI